MKVDRHATVEVRVDEEALAAAVSRFGWRVGHRFNPGHFVSSMTCRDGLTTLPGHGQRVDL
jgi:hypothetical protein